MVLTLITLHCIASIFLLYVILIASVKCSIKLSIHNAPYVILSTIFLLLTINGIRLHPTVYFVFSGFTLIMYVLLSTMVKEESLKITPVNKVILSCSVGLFWPQFLIYFIFYGANLKK